MQLDIADSLVRLHSITGVASLELYQLLFHVGIEQSRSRCCPERVIAKKPTKPAFLQRRLTVFAKVLTPTAATEYHCF